MSFVIQVGVKYHCHGGELSENYAQAHRFSNVGRAKQVIADRYKDKKAQILQDEAKIIIVRRKEDLERTPSEGVIILRPTKEMQKAVWDRISRKQ